MNKKMPIAENLVYYLWCIFTFGFIWVVKIVIKKAVIEAGK